MLTLTEQLASAANNWALRSRTYRIAHARDVRTISSMHALIRAGMKPAHVVALFASYDDEDAQRGGAWE